MPTPVTISPLELAQLGWSLIPIGPDKKPLVQWREFQDRCATEEEITQWIDRHRNCNWGVATGKVSGVVVLDIDSEAGEEALRLLGVPATVECRTANGRHLYFRHPGFPCGNWAKRIKGCDFRGDGGYVVVPPSTHPSGAVYAWTESPFDQELADMPAWLLEVCTTKPQRPDAPVLPPPVTVAAPEHRNGTSNHIREKAYAQSALQGELEILRHLTEDCHERNDTLNISAFKLGGFIKSGLLDRQETGQKLLDVALAIGLELDESIATIRSGFDAATPREIPAPMNGTTLIINGKPIPENGVEAPEPQPWAPDDIDNGRRLVQLHGSDIRYVATWRRWLCWDGARWRPDDTQEIERRAKDIPLNLRIEAATEKEPAEQGKKWKHAFASGKMQGIRGMVAAASSEPGIAIRFDVLDADPWLLNCQNGTLDLGTGQLREHAKSDMLTKLAPVVYDPAATCPRFLAFLHQIMAGDVELIEFLRRFLGYCLSGVIREHVLVVCYGTGANGKSTLLNTCLHIMGDYGTAPPADLLLLKRGQTHPTESAGLHGKRLAVCAESDEGRRLAEATVKQLTGGDPITTRRMKEDFWTFAPTHKLAFATNHKPVIQGTDHAIWRRVYLVPFDVTIPKHLQDDTLSDQLKAEASGILNWLLAGCLEWQRIGLTPPARVLTATEEYRNDSDVLGRFLADRCQVAPELSTPGKQLWDSWCTWCKEEGEKEGSQTAFGRALGDRGFTAVHSRTGKSRLGIGLIDLFNNSE